MNADSVPTDKDRKTIDGSELLTVASKPSNPSKSPRQGGTNAGDAVLVSASHPTVETAVLGSETTLGSDPTVVSNSSTVVLGPVSTVDDDSTVVSVLPSVVLNSGPTVNEADPSAENDPYALGGEWHYAEKVEGRVFHITTDWVHPITGEVIITPEKVREIVARKGNLRTAWANHDQDRVTADDVEADPSLILGELKDAHVHGVEERRNQTCLAAVSRAWGVPPNFIQVKKGHGVFLDLVEYLLHEHPTQQALGKHQYSDSEINANFPFRKGLADRATLQARGGGKRPKQTPIDVLALRIQEEGLTLRNARKADPLSFNRSKSRMVESRSTFLKSAPMPPLRTNYYFGGPARTGKSTLALLFAHALAALLYPELSKEESVFVVGRKGVGFQEYDGQPILVWDDFRVASIVDAVGGSRDALWPAFDISPKPVDVNRKYGSVRLCSAVNIITGIQPYEEFLESLAGRYKDKHGEEQVPEDRDQAYGRIPFVTEVKADIIRFYLNKGFAGTGTYQEYQQFATLRTNMREVSEALEAIEDEDEKEQARLKTGQHLVGELIAAHRSLKSPARLTGDQALAQIQAATTVYTGVALEEYELDEANEKAVDVELERVQKYENRREAAIETALALADRTDLRGDFTITHHADGGVSMSG